jgi:hypothetical protein
MATFVATSGVQQASEAAAWGDEKGKPVDASGVEGRDGWVERYDLNLWIGHPFEGATYLPR